MILLALMNEYQQRFQIERSNAWMNFNRTLLIHFGTSIESLAFYFPIAPGTSFITNV